MCWQIWRANTIVGWHKQLIYLRWHFHPNAMCVFLSNINSVSHVLDNSEGNRKKKTNWESNNLRRNSLQVSSVYIFVYTTLIFKTRKKYLWLYSSTLATLFCTQTYIHTHRIGTGISLFWFGFLQTQICFVGHTWITNIFKSTLIRNRVFGTGLFRMFMHCQQLSYFNVNRLLCKLKTMCLYLERSEVGSYLCRNTKLWLILIVFRCEKLNETWT